MTSAGLEDQAAQEKRRASGEKDAGKMEKVNGRGSSRLESRTRGPPGAIVPRRQSAATIAPMALTNEGMETANGREWGAKRFDLSPLIRVYWRSFAVTPWISSADAAPLPGRWRGRSHFRMRTTRLQRWRLALTQSPLQPPKQICSYLHILFLPFSGGDGTMAPR